MADHEFEKDVIERLARLETKLENGVTNRITAIENWIKSHPANCPLAKRKTDVIYVIAIIGGTGALVAAIDFILHWIGIR